MIFRAIIVIKNQDSLYKLNKLNLADSWPKLSQVFLSIIILSIIKFKKCIDNISIKKLQFYKNIKIKEK